MADIHEKAAVLIEALPYIKLFNQKIVVVKYGGSAMVDSNAQASVLSDIALLKLVGMKPIVVHGGGKEISKWVRLSGQEPEFVDGLRVTDESTMDIAEMVLNKMNKDLVGCLQKIGVNAVGICGKDCGTFRVSKHLSNGRDIGFVGDIDHVDTMLIETLLTQGYVPVIAPIGMDNDYNSFNINADDAACAVAKAMQAEKLAFLTDTEGIYEDVDDDNKKVVSVLTLQKGQEMVDSGAVSGGMIPKLLNCMEAVREGVSRVHILDGRVEHALLLEFFTDKGIGTAILEK